MNDTTSLILGTHLQHKHSGLLGAYEPLQDPHMRQTIQQMDNTDVQTTK